MKYDCYWCKRYWQNCSCQKPLRHDQLYRAF